METAVTKVNDLTYGQQKLLTETHRWVGKLLVSETVTAEKLETQTSAIKQFSLALLDSKHSVDDSRVKLTGAITELARLREVTGSHALLDPEGEGDAPTIIHVWIRRATNAGWKVGTRYVIAALGAGGGLALLWQNLAQLFKLLWG